MCRHPPAPTTLIVMSEGKEDRALLSTRCQPGGSKTLFMLVRGMVAWAWSSPRTNQALVLWRTSGLRNPEVAGIQPRSMAVLPT